MAGKFINRWNGPYRITKSYSKVNYEIENLQDKKKGIIVHVNRIKKFNQREDDSTFPQKNIQPPQIINTDTHRNEDTHNNNDPPPTAVRRGRGRPLKNTTQASELAPAYQNHITTNLTNQHQHTKQQRQPERLRNNRQNKTSRFFKDFSPP